MIVPFRAMPNARGTTPRPLIDVAVTHDTTAHVLALCDTGSLHNRFGAWIADEIGIDLRNTEPEAIGVGGQHLLARTVPVALRIGEHEWEAPVSFCAPWPWSYQLLGQEGFLRWFEIVLRTADRELELSPLVR